MTKTDKEIAENQRERAKRQNKRALELWDCVSARLPKGTKERIVNCGFSVNGFIIDAVLEKLERTENRK